MSTDLFNEFINTDSTSLKICGVTRIDDAKKLVELGVHAIGINFWELSKRYLAPESAQEILDFCHGKILRVGVFVNAPSELPFSLLKNKQIDIAQFHGDETPEYCAPFFEASSRYIRAIGVKNAESLSSFSNYKANAILLDTPAPGVYGGTGETFDWSHAKEFKKENPQTPIILAGGITPENASLAIESVKPAALDVASGAESAPGIKDMKKVAAILAATQKP